MSSREGFVTIAMIGLLTSCTSLTVAAPPRHWPQFRGPHATGIADAESLPAVWDVKSGTNVRWKTPIPGLAHSSPIAWGDRVFVTSAVSGDPDAYLRLGMYSESPDHPENLVHDFRVYCLDRHSGNMIWEKTAHSGIPKFKRHVKSSHANPTPATDGKHVVAFFGSEGLYTYDIDGNLLWKKDLGSLDAGSANAPELQWGFGSSPVIYKNMIIVQCDVNSQSFVAALDLHTGEERWRTVRDVYPGWGTPTVHESPGRTQVIVNGYRHICGYDILTGKELWRLTGGGDIPVPTPYVAHNLVFVTNGHGALRPIYAIRLDAHDDISLTRGETSNEYVVWSRLGRGTYIPTTIVYGDYVYVGQDRAILSCYEARTGKKIYRTRLAGVRGATYSASPVAGDGKIFFTSEDGDVHVIKAGPEYELLATNPMGEPCLATPAIAGGMLLIRTRNHVFGIGL